MAMLGMICSVVGLLLVLAAGVVLLFYLFIPEEELTRLKDLPIEASSSHLSAAANGRTLSAAVTDITKLDEYRQRFIAARREERQKGRWGLRLLIGGSFLQIVGVILGFLSTSH